MSAGQNKTISYSKEMTTSWKKMLAAYTTGEGLTALIHGTLPKIEGQRTKNLKEK